MHQRPDIFFISIRVYGTNGISFLSFLKFFNFILNRSVINGLDKPEVDASLQAYLFSRGYIESRPTVFKVKKKGQTAAILLFEQSGGRTLLP